VEPHAWRLDVARAAAVAGPLYWKDGDTEVQAEPEVFGDVVLARKDAPVSYHLAVTVDDAAQGVTDVVRGRDLYAATDVHRLLQALLAMPTPHYHHHPLLADAEGRRLAKRHGAPTLAGLRVSGVDPAEIVTCVLDRPRHSELIAELRSLGCGVRLIPDGDVAGVIDTTDPDTGVDVYMGAGGAPEGVLAAAALRCVGGQIQGRLLFRNEDEEARARRWGIDDLDRVYALEDMAKGDCIFAATGVTDGSLLEGVHRGRNCVTTESIVMRASSGTVRRVATKHNRWTD
jgi:hypothetical protein